MQTVQPLVRLLLSVLSASTLFDKVGLWLLKHFMNNNSRPDWLLLVLLSDPETQTLSLVYLILKALIISSSAGMF